MRHRVAMKKLGRPTGHRLSLIRNLMTDLIRYERLRTTEPKAAELRREVERLIGTARQKASVLSFVMDGIHPHDVGTILDLDGIAVRAGHHCAQPVMERFGVPATARASFAFYNTLPEVDALADAVGLVRELFG